MSNLFTHKTHFRHLALTSAGAVAFMSLVTLHAEVRCTFDVGSGDTRVVIADVQDNDQVKILATKVVGIPFKKQIVDGVMSSSIIDTGVAEISKLKDLCAEYKGSKSYGVATSGFRMAEKNGKAALRYISQQTKVNLRIVQGDEEALIGLQAASLVLGGINTQNVVTLDVGGGSYQIATSNQGTFSTELGSASFFDLLKIQFNRKENEDLQPLNQAEFAQAIDISKESVQKLNSEIKSLIKADSTLLAGIGGIINDLTDYLPSAFSKDSYGQFMTAQNLRQAALLVLNKTTAQIQVMHPTNRFPNSEMTNLALLIGIIEGLDINKVYAVPANLAHGIIIDTAD